MRKQGLPQGEAGAGQDEHPSTAPWNLAQALPALACYTYLRLYLLCVFLPLGFRDLVHPGNPGC